MQRARARNFSSDNQKKSATDIFSLPFDLYDRIYEGRALTSAESSMLYLKNKIIIKPNWQKKIFDENIITKWKLESFDHTQLSKKCFDYMIAELRYYAKNSINITKQFYTSTIDISSVDNVYQSDNLINNSIRQKLTFYLETLKFPEKFNLNGVGKLDWHPNSNEQILDLIHPSLFCYIKDVSINKNKNIIGVEIKKKQPEYTSKKYQWLPTDVQIDQYGNSKFMSYINNLHPQTHKELYSILENVLSCFIPMFDIVLTDMINVATNRIDTSLKRPDAFKFDPVEFHQQQKSKNIYTLKGKMIQIIVKAAQIILTPDNPTYDGGVWHVEGMKNESIVASGIYYYDQANISESRLDFRMAGYDPEYIQDDRVSVNRDYNLNDGEIINNYLGYVLTTNDRAIVFPNVYQHKVEKFSLVDKTKPGYRRILVFFLVDPNTRIISTSDVDPQQDYWYDDKSRPNTTMTYEQACTHRNELMKERKFMINDLTENIYEREFSLCEH